MTVRPLAGLLLLAGAASGAQVQFQRLKVPHGEAQSGVFSVDLDGDGCPDLLTMGSERISIRRGQPGQKPMYPDEPEVLVTGPLGYFADVAEVLPAKGKELLLLTPIGVVAFVHENGRYASRPQPLLKCETALTTRPFLGPAGGAGPIVEVLPWNFAFDADGDGRDDILIPDIGGTAVHLQKAPGQFAPPLILPLFPMIYRSVISGLYDDEINPRTLGTRWALPARIEHVVRKIESRDVNGDGKPDLVSGSYYFAQKATGGFETTPTLIPGGPKAPSRLSVDIDGDGHLDRIAPENDFKDPFNILTRVRIFLADADGKLPEAPTQTIPGQNILVYTDLPIQDFNGDGALDFAMFKTDITPVDIGRWVRQNLGQIDGDLNFYLFDKRSRRYPRSPSYSKPIRLRFRIDPLEAIAGLIWDRYLGTMMRFEGDFNADGRPDLLVREETNAIAIYFNTGTRDLFPRNPDIRLENTPDFNGLVLADLNGDGAADIILYAGRQPFGPMGPLTNVVAVYISELR